MKLTLPDKIWGRLATTADDRGVSVEDLLVEAITNVLRPDDRPEQIVTMARAGLPDRVICERLDESRAFVAGVRRRAGIPANKQRRTDYERTKP